MFKLDFWVCGYIYAMFWLLIVALVDWCMAVWFWVVRIVDSWFIIGCLDALRIWCFDDFVFGLGCFVDCADLVPVGYTVFVWFCLFWVLCLLFELLALLWLIDLYLLFIDWLLLGFVWRDWFGYLCCFGIVFVVWIDGVEFLDYVGIWRLFHLCLTSVELDLGFDLGLIWCLCCFVLFVV